MTQLTNPSMVNPNPNMAMNSMLFTNHMMTHFNGIMNSNGTFFENIGDSKFISQTFIIVIQILIISLFSAFSNHLSDAMMVIKNFTVKVTKKFVFGVVLNPIYKLYVMIYKFVRGIKPLYHIQLSVSLITTESKKNADLFQIIQWFVASDNCIKEEPQNNITLSKEIYFQNTYKSIYDFDKTSQKIPFSVYHTIDESFYIIFEKHKILCSKTKNKIELNGDVESQTRDNITYFFETYDENKNSTILEDLCNHAVVTYNNSRGKWTQTLYTNKGKEWIKCRELLSPDNTDSIVLRKGVKEDFVSSIEFFFKNKDFYIKNGQRHKYVTLLLGPPGTGKTTLITAFANQNKRHIYSLNMKNSVENELESLIANMDTLKGDLLIDDFDQYFNTLGGENKSCDTSNDDKIKKITVKEESKKPLSYHEFLTVLDGMGSKEGMNIYICVNDPSKIFKSTKLEDLALIRDRRVNKIINFEYCDHHMIRNIYKNIFGRDPDNTLIEKIKEDEYAPCTIVQQFMSFVETHGGKVGDDKQKDIDNILKSLADNNIKTNQAKLLDYIKQLERYNCKTNDANMK